MKKFQDFRRHCLQCQSRNLQTPDYIQLSLEIPRRTMNFIAMDFIGPFEVTSNRKQYAPTVIFMLTINVFCVPLPVTIAHTVVNVWFRKV